MIAEIKEFSMDDFVHVLQKNFDTFLMEIDELSYARENEERLNTFLQNLEVFRNNNIQMKEEFRRRIKIQNQKNNSI